MALVLIALVRPHALRLVCIVAGGQSGSRVLIRVFTLSGVRMLAGQGLLLATSVNSTDAFQNAALGVNSQRGARVGVNSRRSALCARSVRAAGSRLFMTGGGLDDLRLKVVCLMFGHAT